MKTSIQAYCFCVVLLISHVALAQQKSSPAWTARFGSAISWQRVHSLGYLLVSTSTALYGVNPTDGKILWENTSFGNLDPSTMEEIEGTEFISISYPDGPTTTVPLQTIVEVVGGKVLFDSRKESIGVLSRHVLPRSGKLLVIGVKQKTELKDMVATLFMYDITSGKQLWVNDALFKPEATSGKGLLGKLQALGEQFGNLQKLTGEPLEVDDQHVVITHPGYVMKLKSATGELVWKNKIETSTKAKVMFSSYKKNVTFVATEVESESGSGFTTTSGNQPSSEPRKFYTNLYYAFNSDTGAPLWKAPAKENDLLNLVIMHEKGIIICPRSSQKPTINLVNYETGQTLWGNKGKGVKAQGSVVSYIPTSKGILITTAFDNVWNNKAEEYYLNVLDPQTGTLKYEKSVKLKGDLVRSEIVPKGLLVITSREINILDINTGLLLWPNSIEAGSTITKTMRPFPTGEQGNSLFVYSPKAAAVFEVNKETGAYRKFTSTPIEFQGKELPTAIDVVSDGLILFSEQNVMKVGMDGAVKYSAYYPAPRQPALLRALLAAQAVRAAYIGAAASAYSAAFAQAGQQSTDPTGKEVGREMSQAFGQLSSTAFAYSSMAMKQFNARFKASQSTPNFIMIMTTQDKKGNQLVQVSKSNGEIQRSIDIKNDREPEYDVDQVLNYVYYRSAFNEIVCYKL